MYLLGVKIARKTFFCWHKQKRATKRKFGVSKNTQKINVEPLMRLGNITHVKK